MYSAYKLNKQGDNIQPWNTPFPTWNQSVVPCPVLTVASWPAYRLLRRQVGGLVQFSSVQLLRVWLFATPWITACQASLSITNSALKHIKKWMSGKIYFSTRDWAWQAGSWHTGHHFLSCGRSVFVPEAPDHAGLCLGCWHRDTRLSLSAPRSSNSAQSESH